MRELGGGRKFLKRTAIRESFENAPAAIGAFSEGRKDVRSSGVPLERTQHVSMRLFTKPDQFRC